jgi:hypothetical protein
MLSRCSNPNIESYPDYGGRGISVCPQWRDFAVFLADMGECPEGLTLDRVDNNKDYMPGNCRWATYSEQLNNTRSTIRISVDGITKSLTQWARDMGINARTVRTRIYSGMTPEEALFAKPKIGRPKKKPSPDFSSEGPRTADN